MASQPEDLGGEEGHPDGEKQTDPPVYTEFLQQEIVEEKCQEN